MEAVHLKYLAVNPVDLQWGTAVNSVGFQEIAPGMAYPPRNHPSRYIFTIESGRVLEEYQLLYITEGRGKFYCQTNRDYLKCRQIARNPNAALCFGKYSIEGRCSILGRPYDVPGFIPAMEKSYPDAVKRWSMLPEECVLEITPTVIRSWIYENDVPYTETWDFSDNTFRKERQ